MVRISHITLAVLALVAIDTSSCMNHVPAQEWADYKQLYQKEYPTTGTTEALAQYYYAYNKRLIDNHNLLYQRGQRTFSLRINQFTDMRLIHFNALFPVAKPLTVSNASPAPRVSAAPTTYNPFTSLGFTFIVEDQGTKCNSGWAYTAAKSVEILKAVQSGKTNPVSLSAQSLIDCSGRATACTSQVPQTAFDYLTLYDMDLLPTTQYPNQNTLTAPGMCVAKGTSTNKLAEYATFTSNDDVALKSYVGAGYPVIVDVNPTSFEFMHYGEGVYQPPRTSATGSHSIIVVGYDRDVTTGTDYWILQNSFGRNWGEQGLMRMVRSSTVKLAKNPIFPSMIA